MQEVLKEYLREGELAQQWQAVETAETLEAMLAAAWVLARALALLLMSQVLEARAAEPVSWPECKVSGQAAAEQRVDSKAVAWADRASRVAPTRRALPERMQDWAGGALGSGAGTASVCALQYRESQEMACLLAVLMPFELASRVALTPRRSQGQCEWRVAMGTGTRTQGDGAAGRGA